MQDIVIKIKNVENRINELKSELSIVWDNAYSFNSGYTSLKTCLYKATNAKYYNRLIDNNNEEQTSLFLYFLSGRIVSCPIKRNGDKLIQAFFMNEKQEIVKLEEEVRTCLLFEDTREGMVGRKLEQWNEELDEEMFMKKVSVGLKSYYAISYKLKKL